jgi:hypothetical protein
MRQRARCAVVGLLAALILAVGAAASLATDFHVNLRSFNATWPRVVISAGGTSFSCAITLGGSFHETTFSPTIGDDVGSVTRATLGACTGGTGTLLTGTLPWDITYAGFSGAPEEVTSVALNVLGASFQGAPSGLGAACLIRSTVSEPMSLSAQRERLDEISELSLEPDARIDLTGGFICDIAGDAAFAGNAEVTATSTEGGEIGTAELVVDNRGHSLVAAPAEDNLVPVLIEMANGSRELSLNNIEDVWNTHIVSVATDGVNSNRFAIGNPAANRCINGFELIDERDNLCTIRIERLEGTGAGVQSRVRIIYTLGPFSTAIVEQTFNISS